MYFSQGIDIIEKKRIKRLISLYGKIFLNKILSDNEILNFNYIAREECRKRKIDPYIAVGAFIDETIRELSKVNSDEKVAEFLISIAGKVKSGMYKKKKST